MDPIHPIVPVTPNILPILRAPRVGHVDRDAQRDRADGRRPERRRRDGGDGDGGAGDEGHDGSGSGSGPGPGPGPGSDTVNETAGERGLLGRTSRGELLPGEEDDGLGHVDLTA